MQILRVFNNNVVLARRTGSNAGTPAGEDTEDVIVTGRGIGFQAKAGDAVDPAKVVKVFVPASGRDPDHSAAMLAAVPGEFIQLVLEAMDRAHVPDTLRGKLTLVVALADHVHSAVNRGISIEYPLEAEVRHLYAEDFALASTLLQEINTGLHSPLPESEAVALTLHLVNAGFTVGDLSGTYRMTGLIQQLLDIIGSHNGVELESEDLSVARFITHLRYLFVRMAEHSQLDSPGSPVSNVINDQYPDAAQCARTVAGVIELRMNESLTADEITYLTLHIARLAEATK
ncbi:PRD domain-containing protein [Corynebacterium striatum]|uniref:PRD domain-containing protein n=1 Tax=Corynebacterium striatum TaxID=43770 RepID=UPI003B5BB6C4